MTPPLERDDVDVALLVISAGNVAYRNPVEDTIFNANKVYKDLDNETWYTQDWPARGLACTKQVRSLQPRTEIPVLILPQYQFCVAQSSGDDYCSAFGPHMRNASLEDFPRSTDTQLVAIQ
jgi:hypothetical protein